MNKQDLVNEIAARSSMHHPSGISLTKVQATAALDALSDIAHAQLTKPGAELTMPGIGKLKAVHKEARTGRNPKTGADLAIPAKTAVKFTAAKALKDAVA